MGHLGISLAPRLMLADMRISLELVPAEADRLEGRILTDDGVDQAFSGTLDLLRVLEEIRRAHVDAGEAASGIPTVTPSQIPKESSPCC